MKRSTIICLLMGLSLFTSNTLEGQGLTGKISDTHEMHDYIYLLRLKTPGDYYNGSYFLVFDSARLGPDGSFAFPDFTRLDTNYLYRLSLVIRGDNPGAMYRDFEKNNYVFVPNIGHPLHIVADASSIYKTYQFESSPIQHKLIEAFEHIRDLEMPLFSMKSEFLSKKDSIHNDSVGVKQLEDKFLRQFLAFAGGVLVEEYKEVLASTSDFHLTSFILSQLIEFYPLSGTEVPYEEYIDHFMIEGDTRPYILWWIKQFNKEKKSLQVGQQAVDVIGVSPDGDTLHLKGTKGKLILLDFWASWCGPCRRENKETVLPLYKALHEKGFNVFGISTDMDEKSWKTAIEKDGLPWIHINIKNKYMNEVFSIYNVKSLPTTYLLDESFNILAKDVRSEVLTQFITDYFEKK